MTQVAPTVPQYTRVDLPLLRELTPRESGGRHFGQQDRMQGVGELFGQSVDGSSILIRYTRGADGNLDGVVDDKDVTIIANGYNQPASGAS